LTLTQRAFQSSDLSLVEPWFDDPATRRWLGDREWPKRLLKLAREPGRFAILFSLRDDPVVLLDRDRNSDGTAAFRNRRFTSPWPRASRVAGRCVGVRDAGSRRSAKILAEVELGNTAAQRLVRSLQFEAILGAEEGFERYVLSRT
jgi:hypothetical protein